MMFFITILAFGLFGLALYNWLDSATNQPLPEQDVNPQLGNTKSNIIIPDEVKDIQNNSLKSIQTGRGYIEKIDKEKNSLNSKINNINSLQNNNSFNRVADYDTFYEGIRKSHKMKKYKENKAFLKKRKKLTLQNNQDDDNNGAIKNL